MSSFENDPESGAHGSNANWNAINRNGSGGLSTGRINEAMALTSTPTGGVPGIVKDIRVCQRSAKTTKSEPIFTPNENTKSAIEHLRNALGEDAQTLDDIPLKGIEIRPMRASTYIHVKAYNHDKYIIPYEMKIGTQDSKRSRNQEAVWAYMVHQPREKLSFRVCCYTCSDARSGILHLARTEVFEITSLQPPFKFSDDCALAFPVKLCFVLKGIPFPFPVTFPSDDTCRRRLRSMFNLRSDRASVRAPRKRNPVERTLVAMEGIDAAHREETRMLAVRNQDLEHTSLRQDVVPHRNSFHEHVGDPADIIRGITPGSNSREAGGTVIIPAHNRELASDNSALRENSLSYGNRPGSCSTSTTVPITESDKFTYTEQANKDLRAGIAALAQLERKRKMHSLGLIDAKKKRSRAERTVEKIRSEVAKLNEKIVILSQQVIEKEDLWEENEAILEKAQTDEAEHEAEIRKVDAIRAEMLSGLRQI